MNIPERATKEQTEAITQTEGNIRVASVPGSGKTFVLTYRIAYLITELFLSHHLLWRLHLRTRQLRR